MKSDQNSCKAHSSEDIDKKYDVDNQIANFWRKFEPCKRNDDLNEHKEGKEKDWKNKREEVTVVSLADAGADPGTVMIESLHTDVAIIAVRGPWWAKDVTSIAKFYP